MIKEMQIKNFRCFKEISIKGFTHINLIVGDNGAGKTTLLEAIAMAHSKSSLILHTMSAHRSFTVNYNVNMEDISKQYFENLFHNANQNEPIEFISDADGAYNRKLSIFKTSQESTAFDPRTQQFSKPNEYIMSWTDKNGNDWELPNPFITSPMPTPNHIGFSSNNEPKEEHYKVFYFGLIANASSPEIVANFSIIQNSSDENKLKEFKEIIFNEYPWVEDIFISAPYQVSNLAARVKPHSTVVPISNISSGISKIIPIIVSMINNPNSVILIDEIENGIYYKHLPKIWSILYKLAKQYKCQLFVTTHSLECISAFSQVVKETPEDLSLFRFTRVDEGINYKRFSGNLVESALDYEMDLRG
jgi:AAA15 family ATPase/GTPase